MRWMSMCNYAIARTFTLHNNVTSLSQLLSSTTMETTTKMMGPYARTANPDVASSVIFTKKDGTFARFVKQDHDISSEAAQQKTRVRMNSKKIYPQSIQDAVHMTVNELFQEQIPHSDGPVWVDDKQEKKKVPALQRYKPKLMYPDSPVDWTVELGEEKVPDLDMYASVNPDEVEWEEWKEDMTLERSVQSVPCRHKKVTANSVISLAKFQRRVYNPMEVTPYEPIKKNVRAVQISSQLKHTYNLVSSKEDISVYSFSVRFMYGMCRVTVIHCDSSMELQAREDFENVNGRTVLTAIDEFSVCRGKSKNVTVTCLTSREYEMCVTEDSKLDDPRKRAYTKVAEDSNHRIWRHGSIITPVDMFVQEDHTPYVISAALSGLILLSACISQALYSSSSYNPKNTRSKLSKNPFKGPGRYGWKARPVV